MREALTEALSLLLLKSIKEAKKKPVTKLESRIAKLPSELLEALISEVNYIRDQIIKPFLNTLNVQKEYGRYLGKYYLLSRSLIFKVLLSYFEGGDVSELKDFAIDLTKLYYDHKADLQKLKGILSEDEIDTLLFVFLSGCECNLGMLDTIASTPLDVYAFLKRTEVLGLVAYAAALDFVLSCAYFVSAGEVELNNKVRDNLKHIIGLANDWAAEVFRRCIIVGISHGDNVLKALPELKEDVLKEIEEGLTWLASKLTP